MANYIWLAGLLTQIPCIVNSKWKGREEKIHNSIALPHSLGREFRAQTPWIGPLSVCSQLPICLCIGWYVNTVFGVSLQLFLTGWSKGDLEKAWVRVNTEWKAHFLFANCDQPSCMKVCTTIQIIQVLQIWFGFQLQIFNGIMHMQS